ncbi:aspartic peptidase domain-containing protein [Pyrenochaeta sp. MPI-SDFR-AT-0127]|nr:aspartic peptidase domain-containing protein [Pyrenochaeta sp. MPI-SDFR-AT-0127]
MSNSTRAPAPLVVQNSQRWLGNDGTWSTFYVHVGTPPQHFHVLPSFNGQTIYLPIDQDCERLNITDCGSLRGVEVFQARPSLGFQPNASSTWDEIGIYRIGLGYLHGLTGNGVFGFDTVGTSTGTSVDVPTLKNQAIAAYATEDFWLGQLGLSMFPLNMSGIEAPHSFLSRLKEEGHIPSLSFGFQAGAAHRFTKVPGSLILGGYDRSRRSNNSLLVPATEDITIGLQSITATLSNGTVTTLLNRGILAVMNTDVPELWLPPSVCDTFASALGLTYHNESNRYALTEATHSQLQDLAPKFSFKIGTSVASGESIIIEIPYAAFDLQANYPIYTSPTNYFPLRRALNEGQYALGRAFLQEVYLTVDWERDIFNVSQAVFSAPPPEPDIVTIEPKNRTLIPIPGPGGDSNNSTKLGAGAIAGIVIGSILLVVLVVGGWWFYRRRKVTKKYAAEQEALPVEEKKDPREFAPEAMADKKTPVEKTNLELEGRMVEEMYAPHGESEVQQHTSGEKATRVASEAVEMESPQPIYELPSSDVNR